MLKCVFYALRLKIKEQRFEYALGFPRCKPASQTCFPFYVFFALRFAMDGRCRVRRKENVRLNIKWLMVHNSNAVTMVTRLEEWSVSSLCDKKVSKAKRRAKASQCLGPMCSFRQEACQYYLKISFSRILQTSQLFPLINNHL